MTHCKEHGVTLPCPLCAQDLWPLRDLRAVADFAGNPLNGPNGLIPGRKYVRLSDVVRSIGRRWAELERVKLTVLAPLYTTKNALVREARIGAIDIGRLEKAARQVAKGFETDSDPIVEHYMRAIIDEESSW